MRIDFVPISDALHRRFCAYRSNPNWAETKFLLVNSLTENLCLRLWDYNDHRANTDLGCATFDLKALQQDATQEDLELPVLKDGKDRGTLRFEVNFFPELKPEVDAGGLETVPDTSKLPSAQ